MWKWFKNQNSTVKGMVILALLMIIGIILRWDYITKELSITFNNMFPSQDKIEQVEPANND